MLNSFFKNSSQLLGRVAIAFCFLSFGIWEIVDPSAWMGYLPSFIPQIVAPELMIQGHGVALSIIGLGVLVGFWLPVFTGLAVLMLLQIVLSLVIDSGWNEIVIRDIALLLFTVGVFLDVWRTRKV